MPRLFRTASFRLTALYAVVAVLSFTLLLILTYATLTSALRDQIKVKVGEDLNAIAAEAASDGASSAMKDIEERVRISASQGAYYFLSDKSGHRLAGNLERAPQVVGWQEQVLDDFLAVDSEINADEDHQLWGQGMFLNDGSFLFAGQDAYRVLSAQEAVVNTFLWSAGIALLLAASAGAFISYRFLHRIDAINRTSQAIIDGRLKARIPVRGTSDEVDQLSANLNRLFDSNQRLLESLKQVSASIAHDLRTPLSRLQQGLDEARSGPEDIGRYRSAIDTAIADSEQILSTFAALLRIAQIESGSRKAGFRAVDLSAILNRIAAAYRPVAEDQGKTLTASVEAGVMFHGDADLLLQAVANLLENALRHTPPGTRVDVELRTSQTRPLLSISDNGPGIPAEMRNKVFERFFRLDQSRTTPGSGLGLALVAAVAELHGMEVLLEDNNPGLRVRLISHDAAQTQPIF